MARAFTTAFFFLIMAFSACNGQQTTATMDKNPLLCDPVEGACEIPGHRPAGNKVNTSNGKKSVKAVYFTDPICSSCWGIEPQLRKLKLEYGHDIEIEYRMGGLLPDWSYNSGGISKPSDVAHHWDEVSGYYGMPIDGDLWLEDPLHSSYPPSIAFKAAQMQDEEKALRFLRRIREMVFLEKKNITKWEHLADAAQQSGLNPAQLKKDYEGPARERFQADLDLGRQLGVRGFPTLFFSDSLNANQQLVYGFRPYQHFEQAVRTVAPGVFKLPYDPSWEKLFEKYPTLTTREFAELGGTGLREGEALLQQLEEAGKLGRIKTKNGDMWKLRQNESQ